jgi:TonB family protein
MKTKNQLRIVLLLPAILVIVMCGTEAAYSQEKTTTIVSPSLLNSVDSADIGLATDSFISVDSMPEMISQVAPIYPIEEKSKGNEAEVWVRVLVGRSGSVLKATVMKPETGTESFQKAALDAAMQNKFKPATVKGKPVAIWVTYKVNFVLSDKATTPKSPDAPK